MIDHDAAATLTSASDDARVTVRAAARQLSQARHFARVATRTAGGDAAAWLACARHAYQALPVQDSRMVVAAMDLATRASAAIIDRLQQHYPLHWPAGALMVDGVRIQLRFVDAAPAPSQALRVRRASDITMDAFDGKRYSRTGLGVPLALLAGADGGAVARNRAPYSGRFRNVTAWIDPASGEGDACVDLLLADPRRHDGVLIGTRQVPLAADASAAYAWAMQRSKLQRAGMWGLLGGRGIGKRAGVYLLEDYDPGKRPLVMIHGLGSQPLIWSRISNAVWGTEDLRARFQIWQVIYETDAPVLAARQRVQAYLDEAWQRIDPGGQAHARTVLLGHSLGGVIARLLCADSGDALWRAAFSAPLAMLNASDADRALLDRIFHFHPGPGIARAIFLAAPHRGSPAASALLGRLASDVLGRHVPEVQALRRVAQANPAAISPALSAAFLHGSVNSITTLQPEQPVRRALEQLMPATGVPFHTIAGVLPHLRVRTDGVVPLSSASIEGAASTCVVQSGHAVYRHPQAVAEIVRILRLG